MQRRTLFHAAGLMAVLPGLARRAVGAPEARDPYDVYKRLGLRPIINAAGTYTHLGGSLMPSEVIPAMNDAAQGYVPIRDLTKATG
jgi:seryl-tRNA(Sec) selenium transferase